MKSANTPRPPRYLLPTARMMAERAEHGRKVISSEATARSRPWVTAAVAASAGTLQPSPIRKGSDAAV
jgi:hypothetical protein